MSITGIGINNKNEIQITPTRLGIEEFLILEYTILKYKKFRKKQ